MYVLNIGELYSYLGQYEWKILSGAIIRVVGDNQNDKRSVNPGKQKIKGGVSF